MSSVRLVSSEKCQFQTLARRHTRRLLDQLIGCHRQGLRPTRGRTPSPWRVECRLALNQPWGSRRATWPRKRRRQRRRQPRRKRSNRSTKPYGLRIASEVRYTFATRTGGSFRLQNIRTTVRPDRYANGCCITVRVFICANRLSPRMKPVHAAAESALPPMNGHRPFDP